MSGLCTLAVINLLFLYIPSTQTSLPKSSTKSFHIIEKSPEGTVVVNDLRQLLGVISPSEGGGAGTGLLAITNGALPGASAFKIDQTRGSLVVASPPDRDTLCPTNSRGNLDVVSVAESSDHRDAYITVESSGSHYVSGSTSTSSPCVIPITIVYGSPSDPSFDSISIILDDVNDNAPQFDTSGEEHIIRVMETAHSPMETGPIFGGKLTPKRLRIPLPEAIDRDAPENGVRHYRLEGEDAYLFFLDVGRGDESGVSIETSGRHLISSSSDKRLWLVPSRMSGDAHFGLDHEQRKEYRFVLVAVDGGTPPRSGRLPIRLIVEDVNDHVPTFSQTQYSGVVSEDDLPGHVILQVQASDADGKYENHRINFRIPGKEGHSVGSIQYSEAQLAAANFFEIEPINTYDFNTEASGDHRRNVTTGQLIVQRISESQVRAAAKRAIEAAKKLQISNMELPSSRNRYRPPGVRSYILRFLIEAYDFGKPPLSSQVPVYVEIVDVNDEAPKIFVQYISPLTQLSQGRKNCGSLLEGQGRSMIAQVTVIDNDAASINSDVACMLNDTQFALESISTMGNTGWPSLGTGNPDSDVFQTTLMYKLMSNSPIDREGAAGSTVSVQITCTDNQDMDAASKRLTSHMEVCINIEDVNDNPPQFTAAAYTFKVAENVPSNRSRHFMRTKWGHFIGRVHANDRDAGKNARIAYSISQSANGIIDIDADNGSLFLISAFDREKTKHFEFTVVATDQAESNQTTFGRLSSTAEVRIIVTDVNDCQPEFESASYSFEVEENIELAEVGRVKATDADTGDYGRVRYSLSTENFASQSHAERRNSNALITSLFQIDPRLGVIRLRGHLDREKQVHYEFLVLAVDNMPLSGDTPSGHSSAAVRFTATATVLVMVLDQNDNPPQIISPRNLAEFMLSPDQVVAGTTVFTIEAIDSDQGENSTIEYELIATDVNSENVSDVSTSRVTKHFPFAIDQTAGVCYLKQNLLPLGSEGVNLYTFRIKAYDLGTPSSLNSTVTVRIVRGSKGLATTYTDSLLRNRYGAEGSAKIPAGGEGGYASPGDWYADWGGEISGIPNKTLVIIIVATFAVVILLGVLVLVYFRYQRSFNARMFVNGVLGNPPQSKGTEGYIAGNTALHLDSTTDAATRKKIFAEVVPAPWVSASPSSIHSPMTLAYPVSSPRIMSQQQQQQLPQHRLQHSQQQQQFFMRGLASSTPSQTVLKSTGLKSPARFTQITPAPPFTPPAVVFRNYRVAGDSTYQTATSPMALKKEMFQQPDYPFKEGNNVAGGGDSNNSSLQSKSSNLIDNSGLKDGGGTIRICNTNKRNCGRDTANSSDFSDGMLQDDYQSNYQRLIQEGCSSTTAASSQFLINSPQSPLTYENQNHKESGQRRDPFTTNFITPTHLGRSPMTQQRHTFRSLSIDSNLDNLSSTEYPPAIFSPGGETLKRDRSVHWRDPMAVEKRLQFISNTKTLSPEIRGSFV